MKVKEALEHAVNALLLGGLVALSGGIVLGILGLLRAYEVSLEAELAIIGIFLMVLGYVIAKLFSRD
jgi:uncharacterized membrane-anchored protein